MSTTLAPPTPHAGAAGPDVRKVGFTAALHAEWIKLRTVRSTWWTLGALFALGAGLTTLICGLNAADLASGEFGESPSGVITFGMMLAPICAVVLGALVVTTEYATGMIRSTFAAVPSRGTVMAAKAVLLAAVLFVLGTITAFAGFAGGNYFLDREGIGLALQGDVLRAMFGSGIFIAGIGLLTAAVGFLVKHTAGTISIVLALLLVVGNMVMLVPGAVGDLLVKVMPGNAGGAVASAGSIDSDLLGPWQGLGVFALEVALLGAAAWFVVRRRDA